MVTTEWLPWLQTNWVDSGHEKLILVLETNCILQPEMQLPCYHLTTIIVTSNICKGITCLH